MNPVILTITLARTAEEGELLRRSTAALAALGLRVIAADGGSPTEFISHLRGLSFDLVRPERPGLVSQVKAVARRAIELGLDGPLLYTEPDKLAFFQNSLGEFIQRAALTEAAPLLFAARDASSFATFPPLQRLCETAINDLTASLTSAPGDYCYGPLAVLPSAARLILEADDGLGWGWRFFLLGRLASAKRPARLEVMNLPCPEDQRTESDQDRRYRARQLKQNIQGLLAGLG